VEQERISFLRQQFVTFPKLKTYFGYSEEKLQDMLLKLQDEKNLLLAQSQASNSGGANVTTEALVARKRKSIAEATKVKDTCPTFFDETLVVADQLQNAKDEIDSLKSQLLASNKDILSLTQANAHYDKERATLFRDACTLYKRGIIELQLSVFMNYDHDNYENDYDNFYCDGAPIPKNFTDAMHHWCDCPHHRHPVVIVNEHKEDKIDVRLYAEKDRVKNSLYHLYNTISSLLHFNAGEEYPIKILPFANQSDTLALITFLNHYNIPMFVAKPQPIPPLDSASYTAESEVPV